MREDGHRRILTLSLAAGLVLAGVSTATIPQMEGVAGNSPDEDLPVDGPPVYRPHLDATARSPQPVVVLGAFRSTQINVDGRGLNIVGDAANEPSIAASSLDPDNLVVGFRHFATNSSDFREAGVAYSFDGGETWTFPGPIDPGVFRTDPVIDVDSSGRFVYQSLHLFFSRNPTEGRVFENHMFYSADGGVSWGAPIRAWGYDKNWMAVDHTGGAGEGSIYAIWRRFSFAPAEADTFSRSTNGGRAFRPPVALPLVPSYVTMTVGPDSELLVAGTDWTTGVHDDVIAVVRSDDAYRDTPPTFTATTVDLGGTVQNHVAVSPNPGGLLGQVEVAVNHAPGPHRGEVYLLASVRPKTGADPLDVHFSRSTDGGATWEPFRRLNDDTPGAWQWFATMSVAPNGRIDAVWYDNRDTGVPQFSRLYHTYSMDGGVTWCRNLPVSTVFNSQIGFPGGNRKLGDYIDIISQDDGAHVAYAATFNLEQDVYHVKVIPDCNGNGVPDAQDLEDGSSPDCNANGIPDECDAGNPCP